MSVKPLMTLLEKQGFAIVFGLSVLFGAWHAGGWFGNQVVVPVRDGHLRFMDRIAGSSEKSAEGVETMAEGVKDVSRSVEDLGDSVRRMESNLERALGTKGE